MALSRGLPNLASYAQSRQKEYKTTRRPNRPHGAYRLCGQRFRRHSRKILPLQESPLASEGQPILSMPFRLRIPRNHYDAMVAQAMAELPNECCGLLAGLVEALKIARVLGR